jgi:glycosyltransferase involved in cell wall biosynthesis
MLFVGRLAPEKGLVTLVKAWSSFRIPIRLKIVGDGPLLGQVKELAAGQPNIEVLGSRTRVDVLRLMQSASALVFPSEWYEGLPMTIIEALACGTPVIASDLNSLDDLVHDGENGTRFKVGSPESLASAVSRFLSKPDEFPRLRANCRAFYLERFTAESNYTQMLDIYAQALREYKTEASKLCKRP